MHRSLARRARDRAGVLNGPAFSALPVLVRPRQILADGETLRLKGNREFASAARMVENEKLKRRPAGVASRRPSRGYSAETLCSVAPSA